MKVSNDETKYRKWYICELEELIKRIPTKMLSVKFAMRVWEVDMYSSAAGAPGGVT